MKPFVVQTSSYNESLDYIIERLKEREIDLDTRHIVFTPDRYTLSVEKAIMSNLAGKGAFDVSVMTFGRYMHKEGLSGKYISKQCGAMIIRRILDENKDNLICYSRSSTLGTFPAEVYETLMTLKSSMIEPDNLSAGQDNLLGGKLSDIRLIYNEYNSFLKERELKDTADKLNVLLGEIPNLKSVKDSYFYFVGYESLTTQGRQLISSFAKYSRGVTIAVVAEIGGENFFGNPDIVIKTKLNPFCKHILENYDTYPCELFRQPAPIRFFEAYNKRGAAEEICRIIHAHLRQGGKLKDIAIVGNLSDLEKTALDTAEIKYNYDKKYPLSSHPCVRLILDILNGIKTRFGAGSAHLAKNPFSNISAQAAYMYENYCLKYNITRGWMRQFTYGAEDEEYPYAENTRKTLASLVMPFITKPTGKVSEYIALVKNLIEQNNWQKRCEEYAKSSPDDYRPYAEQCFKALLSVLNEMEIIGFHVVTIEDFASMFEAGVISINLSAIPAFADAVTVTDSEGLRFGHYKKVIYINCTDGEFPPYEQDLGMLRDDDIDTLSKSNVIIEPKIKAVNRRRRDNLIQSFFTGDSLDFIYTLGEDGQTHLCTTLYNIKRLFPDITTITEGDRVLCLISANTGLSKGYDIAIKELFYNKKIAKTLVARAFSSAMAYRAKVLSPVTSAAVYALGEDIIPRISNPPQNINAADVCDIMSVSEIENYFDCPYSHFVQYILRCKPRAEGGITPIDTGNILHTLCEIFLKEYNPKSLEQCDQFAQSIMEQIREQDDKLKEDNITYMRMLAEAKSTARALFLQRQNSQYQIISLEQQFGYGDLPPVAIPTTVGELKIRGKIDRIDVFDNKYIHIIDYKSGRIKFSLKNIYFGSSIQLLIYMQALMQQGYIPAGILYFPLTDDYCKSEEEREYRYRMRGVMSRDDNLLLAADKSLPENLKSRFYPINARSVFDGKVEIHKRSEENKLISIQELQGLVNYSVEVAKTAYAEMKEGFIKPTAKQGVCEWCSSKALCGCPDMFNRTDKINVSSNTFVRLTEGGDE